MKKFFLTMACVGVFATVLPGCGGSGKNNTVGVEDKKALEDYETLNKATEDEMNANPPKM